MNLGDEPIFLDTNVLVRANITAYPLHHVALNTIQTLLNNETEIWISRQVIREFIAVVTRPQTYSDPQPIDRVIEQIQFFEQYFQIADDTVETTSRLLALLQQVPVGGKQIHDANIVATMLANRINQLLTHNVEDFQRFAEHITLLPLVGES